ncbi:copper amine oxidase N-terminal domain-containing protein [bacterium]|nr:copper amine oxidase N-terminal domain-containing protein [bacterium]
MRKSIHFYRLLVLSVMILTVLYPIQSTAFAKPTHEDRYWVISASGREIYLSRLTGIEKQTLFENVGEDMNSKISVITSSYNGKTILCKVVRGGIYSYWIVNLDNNTQEKIIDELKSIPFNTMISRDGNWVAFQTDAYVPWLYHVPTKRLTQFDRNIKDGYVSDVRFSYDSKQAIYIKVKFISQEEYFTCLCVRDLERDQDRELTDEYDGSVLSAEFYFDGSRILLTRYLQQDGFITLWDYTISNGRFKRMVAFPDEHVNLGSPSKDGTLIVFCSFNPDRAGSISFWSYRPDVDPVPIYLKTLTSGLIGLRLSHDAKYLIFGTSYSDTFITETDGSWSSTLSKLVDLPNLRDANFYNHPPFPPQISAEPKGADSRIFWNEAKPGTYEVAGYRIYRSLFSSPQDFTLMATVDKDTLQYVDSSGRQNETYYYMVRSFDEEQTDSIPSNSVFVDRVPPMVKIQHPLNGTWFKDPAVQVVGIATDKETGLKSITVQGKPVQTNQSGTFTLLTQLQEGSNVIQAEATDIGENKATDSVLVYLDTQSPVIDKLDPFTESWTNQPQFPVKCRVTDTGSGVRLIRSQHNEKTYDHSSVDLMDTINLKEGKNEWLVYAEDNVGNNTHKIIPVMLDTIPPVIQVDFPQDNQDLYALDTFIRGNARDIGSGLHELTINQEKVEVASDGSFRHSIAIVEGEQLFNLEATDKVGNSTQSVIRIKGVKKIVVQLTIGQETIFVNGKPSIIDAPPFIHVSSGRTMVPIRFIVEPIGGKIDFDSLTQKITIMREKDEILLWIGKNTGLVNNQLVPIDRNDITLTPMIQDSRTFLPLRFVSENIGFKVEWNAKLYQVTLTFPAVDLPNEVH